MNRLLKISVLRCSEFYNWIIYFITTIQPQNNYVSTATVSSLDYFFIIIIMLISPS